MIIKLPEQINTAFDLLEKSGFSAFIVGGCVRDYLLGKEPNDWDISTNAKPFEMLIIFENYKVIETGIQHGTITVVIDKMNIEITTFRIDGNYSDNRRPDEVSFTDELVQDLARRDFTVNALAYNDKRGLVDYFGGINDLDSGIIRCVGNPDLRFGEDALRIMRAIRFSSVLGFEIDRKTSESIHRNRHLLNNISVERIASELLKLLCGMNVERILTDYSDVIFQIIPELMPCKGFEQHTPYHVYDVYMHTVKSVAYSEPVPEIRMAMLLHDIEKPSCFIMDESGIGHFKGHPSKSRDTADEILRRLRYSNKFINVVNNLIFYHDIRFYEDNSLKYIKYILNILGDIVFFMLLDVMRADIKAQSPQLLNRLLLIDKTAELCEDIIKNKKCISLSQLAVNGKDLIKIGFKQDNTLGETLEALLDMVLEEKLENEKDILLAEAYNIILKKQ